MQGWGGGSCYAPLPEGLSKETSARQPSQTPPPPEAFFPPVVVQRVTKGLRILPTNNIKQVQEKEQVASSVTPLQLLAVPEAAWLGTVQDCVGLKRQTQSYGVYSDCRSPRVQRKRGSTCLCRVICQRAITPARSCTAQ